MREQMEIPMTKLNRMILISAAALTGAALTTAAMAAPKQFCQDYARIAVSQAQLAENQNLACTGFRWPLSVVPFDLQGVRPSRNRRAQARPVRRRLLIRLP
jgi:hypothetical protein